MTFKNLEPLAKENRDKRSFTFELYNMSFCQKALMGFFAFYFLICLGCVVGGLVSKTNWVNFTYRRLGTNSSV